VGVAGSSESSSFFLPNQGRENFRDYIDMINRVIKVLEIAYHFDGCDHREARLFRAFGLPIKKALSGSAKAYGILQVKGKQKLIPRRTDTR